MAKQSDTDDGVVLLHGIFRTHRSMGGLANFLNSNGYRVLNLRYPSTRYAIEDIIPHIHPHIDRFQSEVPGRVHFVGYSMGGLVTRAYLHQSAPEKLGRVVMLGTPNQGSEVADFVRNWWLFHKLYGPAGQQLITGWEDAEQKLGKVNYELGILAGNRSLDPLASWIIGKPSDGKVSIESTKIEGMTDHAVIPIDHTFFPNSRRAWNFTLRFLQQGTFAEN